MLRRHRISGSKRHSQIHSDGTSAANRLLVIRYLANGLDHCRFAFVVSKRQGNAVVRNRIKRRLRASVRARESQPGLKAGWDAVFIARRGSQDASFRQLDRAVANLLRRSRILNQENQQNDPGVNHGGVSKSGGESSG